MPYEVAPMDVAARDRISGKITEVHGNRIVAQNAENNAISNPSGAESSALGSKSVQIDSVVLDIVEVWPELPEAIKADILAMVRAHAD